MFDPSLLVVFRRRLLDGAEESLAFEAVLDRLVEHGWVPRRCRQRLDSTHVWGLLSEVTRLECARETLRLLLEDVEAGGRLPGAWSLHWERYTQDAPASDKAGMAEVLGEEQCLGLERPSALYADGAYVCSEALLQAQEDGRELRGGPARPAPDRAGVFTVEAFGKDMERRNGIEGTQSDRSCWRPVCWPVCGRQGWRELSGTPVPFPHKRV
jgi:hypothetical protein